MKAKWILIVLLMCAVARGTPIQYSETPDQWATVAQNAVRQGSETNVGDWDTAYLYLSYALTGETAHTGSKFYIQISPADSGTDSWTTFTHTGPVLVGEASQSSLTADLAVGSTTLMCSVTDGNFDDDGIRLIFIQASTTVTGGVASSTLAVLTAHGASASLTIMDGSPLLYITSTYFYDSASTTTVLLPKSTNRVRVIYDNTFDSNGSSITTRCDITGHKE